MKVIRLFRWSKELSGVLQEACLPETSLKKIAEEQGITLEELTTLLASDAGGDWFEVTVKYPWTYGDTQTVERAITTLENGMFVRDVTRYSSTLINHAVLSWTFPEPKDIDNLPEMVAKPVELAVLGVIMPNFNDMLGFKKPSEDAP